MLGLYPAKGEFEFELILFYNGYKLGRMPLFISVWSNHNNDDDDDDDDDDANDNDEDDVSC